MLARIPIVNWLNIVDEKGLRHVEKFEPLPLT